MAEVLLTMVHAGGGVRRLEVLKQIWPELATDPDFVTMFLDEARLSLRLNHANVVQTYEVLSGGGQLAIAMEYLDGQPLTRVLTRLMRGSNALSLPLRLRIVMNVLAGLEHAHTLTDLDGTPLEVVHRDISPQNVFVTYDGQRQAGGLRRREDAGGVAQHASRRDQGEARLHGARAARSARRSIGAPICSRSA